MTSPVLLRDADKSDFARICALNRQEVRHTSPMDPDRLAVLHALAAYHRVARIDGIAVAFLLAMRHDAAYVNENFVWFARECAEFLYIDRIVVSAEARGLGIASLLYDDLFAYAGKSGISTIVCEYNIQPPNEASRRFHDKYGFRELGTQWLDGGAKRVSLQSVKV